MQPEPLAQPEPAPDAAIPPIAPTGAAPAGLSSLSETQLDPDSMYTLHDEELFDYEQGSQVCGFDWHPCSMPDFEDPAVREMLQLPRRPIPQGIPPADWNTIDPD